MNTKQYMNFYLICTFVGFSTLLVPSADVWARDGEQVYQEICASCHDSGAARTPSKADLQSMSPQGILTALETGPMRVIGIFSMTGPERIAVAEHLSGQTYNADWKSSVANQCEPQTWPSESPFAKPHWNGWGPGFANSRYQPAEMAKLNANELSKLELQWAFAFPGESVVESHASVVDGRLFIGSRGAAVYSLDAASGCTHWRFDTEASVKTAITISKTPIKGKYLAFFGDIGGAIYAVDAANGKLVWKLFADSHPAARTIGGFQYFDGKLYVPISSLEEGLAADPNYECCSFRASIMRIDAATGIVEWKKYIVEEEAKITGKNASGRNMWGPSGAAVWSSPTLDPKRGVLYVSTGDNYSHPESAMSDSVVALSMATGEVEWFYKGLAGDVFTAACNLPDRTNCPEDAGPDYDMGASSMLITLPSGKDVIVAGQKTGVAHILDPDAKGKLLWQKKVTGGGILGGIEWGMANNGKLAFISKSGTEWQNQDFISATTVIDPNKGGGIVALDLQSQQYAWEMPPISCAGRTRCSPSQSAAVTAIPGAVFSGSVSGVMRAFDEQTGKVLWEFDSVRSYESVNGAAGKGGAIDGPGVVVVDGWVYFGSGYAKWGGHGGNVLLAFKVNQ